ncbi:hypothetical protein [Actinoplanes friuliensis]|jgi:hypothetical protein|uniref:Lipoprotein n=1 Tax=Actinoplanes friuliensis DSM 7358 TaxID=1246995 RepID=U5W1H3_9ACTN|nr:hypothetical protein [Actinoplanes friuliensis]AGZ43043.1 hypothetical protein AFR_23875 [Actinoplanes friuliensis DSM 7358]
MRLSLSGSIVVILLLAGGCSSTDKPPAAAPSVSGSPSATTSAVPSPAPSSKAPFAAADGTNLKACADGACEVIVRSGDSVPAAGGLGKVKISVRGDEVTISKKTADGFTSTLTGTPGLVQQINKQLFLIVAVEDGRAVLRMALS